MTGMSADSTATELDRRLLWMPPRRIPASATGLPALPAAVIAVSGDEDLRYRRAAARTEGAGVPWGHRISR